MDESSGADNRREYIKTIDCRLPGSSLSVALRGSGLSKAARKTLSITAGLLIRSVALGLVTFKDFSVGLPIWSCLAVLQIYRQANRGQFATACRFMEAVKTPDIRWRPDWRTGNIAGLYIELEVPLDILDRLPVFACKHLLCQ
jgi:hypothetical protein